MCRVLLVDDEAMARAGLRDTFDWEGNGYRLVGEAANGLKALKWIESKEVDILITDIAMPVMDGLELTRKTRQLCPWVKVLLLSCHSDFEYVREGIRLGASDYILKPTLDAGTLKQALDRMQQMLEEEKQLQMMMDQHRANSREISKRKAESIFLKALHGDRDSAAQLLELRCAEDYQVAVCEFIDENRQQGWTEPFIAFRQALYERADEAVIVQIRSGCAAVWLPSGSGHAFFGTGNILPSGLKIAVKTGLSSTYDSGSQMTEAFEDAEACLDACFFFGQGHIVRADQLPWASSPASEQECVSRTFLALRAALSVMDLRRCEELVRQLAARWKLGKLARQDVLREAEEVLGQIIFYGKGGLTGMPQIGDLAGLPYVDDVISRVEEGLEHLRSGHDAASPESTLHQRTVHRAIQYIHEHYMESITLQEVADHVSVSRNYFSELFKRETGRNFIDFVIDLRINRAKELLAATSLRVYEVAEQAGFNDVKYFSKLFKKIVGMTPAEYQGSGRHLL